MISAGADLKTGNARYQYFAMLDSLVLRERWLSPKGQEIINEWKNSEFDRAVLERLIGKLNGKLDLRGIPLRNANLRKKDLSHCDLFSADMQQTDLWNADLSESYLSQVNISGAVLSWAKVKGTLVDNVIIDANTKLLGIDLSGINTNFALHFLSAAKEQQRIDELKHRHPRFAIFLRITSDYGRSLWRWSAWTAGVIMFFGLIYSIVPGLLQGSNSGGTLDGLYFSAVTFTTLGYGDIYPIGVLAKSLVVVEVFLGYLMGGILIAILTRRVLE